MILNLIKSNKIETTIVGFVLALVLAYASIGNNAKTERVVVECPLSGTTSVKFDNGLYFRLGCSAHVYSNVLMDDLDNGVNVRYRDGGKGAIDGLVRIDLPTDDELMLKVHSDFRSERGVTANLLRPEIKQALNLTAGMVTSEEAYATKRDNIQEWASDQIENGVYSVEVNSVAGGGSEVVINVDENGKYIHNSSPFSNYGIKVASFQVTDWTFEPATEEQIQTKRRAEMAEITAKSEAQTAKQEALTVVEQGKKAVAEEEYKQKQKNQIEIQGAERDKAVAILVAEKAREVNALQEQSAIIDVRTAKQQAQAIKERANAEAYAKRVIIEADGALTQKLEALKYIAEVQANAFAKRAVPTTVVHMGDSSGSNQDAQTNAFMATQLTKNIQALNADLKTK